MCNPIPDFILECIFDSLKEIVVVGWKKYASNPVDYVLNNKKKLKELEKAINDLQEDRNRVCGKADEDEVRFGREVYHVKAWLRQVQDIIDEYRKLEEDRKKHFVASYLNPIQRYGWSKTAQEIKGTVGELQNEKCDIIISSWQDLSSIGVATSEFDYIPLKSRETTKKKIKESLEDPNARLIGVFGATGVGKTTLVKSATALLEKPNEFDVVITVKVTKCPDIKRIQGQIADMLGVKFEGESEHARAITIQDKLKNEKDNILIILDDLCAKIDLNSLGIPSPTDDLGPLLLTKGESSADKQTDGADKEKQSRGID
ncbi:probable disease resistance protein At1g12280 [Arachis ipaensis]|uniref:probable disease resistance protein At1g12280 n=1 Tax=Arachis ipaensis TaxID=130454 RepID=UPI0007AF1E7A|nr:probable disease resistance protein At1g12280 [Arachis ipaensis]